MATWTQRKTGLTIDGPSASNGTNIYYTESPYNVHEYVPATNTVNQIASVATWEADSTLLAGRAICWFNGNLYVAIEHETSPGSGVLNSQVWRWDGGTSWTKVFENTTGNNSPVQLLSDDFFIVLACGVASAASVGFHSADGSSWNSSTFSTPTEVGSFDAGNDWRLGIATSVGDGSSYDYAIQSFAGGTWTEEEVTASNLKYLYAASLDYYWKNDAGTFRYTTDFSSYTTPANASVTPGQSYNFPYSVGYSSTGLDFIFHQLVSGEWDAGETVVSASKTFRQYFRTSDGEVWALFSTEIYQRDEPIPDPVTANARFYFAPVGQSLAEKFTLPFPGVQPGGMTLDRTLGTVVIGSDAPSNEPVVYSTYPYTTGSATYDSFPTGAAIYSLKWI